jgi:nucleotide-binding universal stress UspA family protein
MIRDIVVHLSLTEGKDNAADFAISVAKTFDAHLTGLVFAYALSLASITTIDALPGEVIEQQQIENERVAKIAVDRFERAAGKSGVSCQGEILRGGIGYAAKKFAEMARRYDLSIVGQQPTDELAPELIVESALFESGRPVLIVPYIQTESLKLDTVLMCWDGSRAAARALADAGPFISRAKSLQLVIVEGESGKGDELPGADIAQHLARRRLSINVKRLDRGSIDVPNVILSYAADSSADLIVMGGYGHSRFREFVLGGVTRTMLASMTVPVLMSH